MTDAADTSDLKVLDSMPVEVQNFALALNIIRSRMDALTPEDRSDLFELIQIFYKVDSDDERNSTRQAMMEILAHKRATAKQFLKCPEPAMSPDSRKWAVHVGKAVRDLREAAGLSQVELASKAGLPQSHISRIETAAYTPTHATLSKVAKALNVDVRKIDPCLD